MMLTSYRVLGFGLLIWAFASRIGYSEDFRISSEVFVNESASPISQNLTLFSDRLICDFLMSDDIQPQPKEITIYDSHQKRFVLLDRERKVRTEISDLQIEKLVDALARETQSNEESKFLISDNFTDETDWSEGTVRMSSQFIVYSFKGAQPNEAVIIPPYFQFLDNFTKLNATDPKKFPPFPRMKLNQKIKQLGWIPSEVRVSIKANGFSREAFEAYAKHNLTIGLTSRDRELLANAKQDWLQFKLVELTEYRQVGGNGGLAETKTSQNSSAGAQNR